MPGSSKQRRHCCWCRSATARSSAAVPPAPPSRPPPFARPLLQDRPSASAPAEPTDSPLSEIAAALGQWLALLRNLSLATCAAAGAATAAAGLALLLFLLATTSLAPASDTVVLPLALDFSPTDLVGDAAFLPGALLVEGGGLTPADQQQLGVR